MFMTMMEYFWRASQQIVMLTPNEPAEKADIEGWGSGFFLQYRKRTFFVTCDHNLHMLDDYANGERTGLDFGVAVITNTTNPNNPLSMGLVTISGFYYFESLDIRLPEIEDLKDVAFAEIKAPFPLPILTNIIVGMDGGVIVEEGLEKIIILEESLAEPAERKDYVMTGCIRNKIVDGIRMDRQTTFRNGIRYKKDKTNLNSQLVFENPTTIIYDDWKGLSGSPFFDENGCLIGMVNEVVDDGFDIYVTPIKAITKLLDYAIMVENNQK